MNTNRSLRRFVLFLSLIAPVAVAAPRPVEVALLPAQPGDLVARRLIASEAPSLRSDVPRESVGFTQALRADQSLAASSAPITARSREYFVEIGADVLRAGAPIFTTRPNALVRVHAAVAELRSGRGRELSLDPARLVLRRGQTEYGAGSGMSLLASAEQLAAAGAPFVEGTTAFRIKPELGAGRFEVAAPDVRDDGRYVIQVFEPQSDAVLALRAGQADYLHGETLRVEAALEGRGVAVERAQAFVSSPGGRTWPLTFDRDGATLRGGLTLDALAAPGAGLWEVHVRVEGSEGASHVVRTARVAFACSLPTAGLAGAASVTHDGDGLRVSIGVDVATSGRYEARGVLYGADTSRQMRPLALGDVAGWLEAGRGALTLAFDAGLIEKSGLAAPFELRDLRLLDQGRMGVLHRHARALALP